MSCGPSCVLACTERLRGFVPRVARCNGGTWPSLQKRRRRRMNGEKENLRFHFHPSQRTPGTKASWHVRVMGFSRFLLQRRLVDAVTRDEKPSSARRLITQPRGAAQAAFFACAPRRRGAARERSVLAAFSDCACAPFRASAPTAAIAASPTWRRRARSAPPRCCSRRWRRRTRSRRVQRRQEPSPTARTPARPARERRRRIRARGLPRRRTLRERERRGQRLLQCDVGPLESAASRDAGRRRLGCCSRSW